MGVAYILDRGSLMYVVCNVAGRCCWTPLAPPASCESCWRTTGMLGGEFEARFTSKEEDADARTPISARKAPLVSFCSRACVRVGGHVEVQKCRSAEVSACVRPCLRTLKIRSKITYTTNERNYYQDGRRLDSAHFVARSGLGELGEPVAS